MVLDRSTVLSAGNRAGIVFVATRKETEELGRCPVPSRGTSGHLPRRARRYPAL